MIVLEHLDHVALLVSHRCLLRSRLVAASSLVPLVGRDLAVAGVLGAWAEGVLRLRGAAQVLLIAANPSGLIARSAFSRLLRCRLGGPRLALDSVLQSVLLLVVHLCLLRSLMRGAPPPGVVPLTCMCAISPVDGGGNRISRRRTRGRHAADYGCRPRAQEARPGEPNALEAQASSDALSNERRG